MTAPGDLRIISLVRLWCFLAYPKEIATFRLKLGYWPHPALPRRRNEKDLWRKVFDRNPLFTELGDKIRAKTFALEREPSLLAPRTLWRGARVEDIPAEILAGDVIVKANHGSGWNFVIRGGKYDRRALIRKTRKWMRRTYGRRRAQWGYYGIRPELFVEELLAADGAPVVSEYKVYAGAGEIAFVFVRRRADDGTILEAVLDEEGRAYPERYDSGVLSGEVTAPPEFAEICALARRFSTIADLIRVDFNLFRGAVYFSEFTFYPAAGYAWIDHDGLNRRFTGLWDLRRSWFLTAPQRGWRKRYAEALRRVLDAAPPPSLHPP